MYKEVTARKELERSFEDMIKEIKHVIDQMDDAARRGVEFTRALGDTPWHSREFVVKDCDGRLLAFGADLE